MTIDELKKVPFRETCHMAMEGEYTMPYLSRGTWSQNPSRPSLLIYVVVYSPSIAMWQVSRKGTFFSSSMVIVPFNIA